jgi:hypothetical protein
VRRLYRIGSAAAAGALALMLAACGTTVTSGTVYDKEHDPAGTTTTCDRYGGSGTRRSCTKWKTKTKPEHWELKLRNGKGDTGEVEVDRATYDRYQIGDHYPKS